MNKSINFFRIGILVSLSFTFFGSIQAQINNGTNTLGGASSSSGNANTVSGSYSFTNGQSNNVTGGYSSALGLSNTVSGYYGNAFGYLNNVSGNFSFAATWGSKAQNNGSVALGYYADANANYSIAIGNRAKTTGTSSLALGYYSEASGSYSLGFGTYTKASNTSSITIGSGINSGSKLDNNITNSLMIGFNSDVPTFYVGASSGTGTTGNVGIANSSPQAKLHITGNGEVLLLEGTDHSFMTFYPDSFVSGRKALFGFKGATDNHITLENEISGGDISIITDTGSINLIGSVWTREIVVQLTDPWPDYVFEGRYQLKSLGEVEKYIEENNHLPEIPSASVIKDSGVNLAEMDALLLKKIEELTLYTIGQQKLIDEQAELIKLLLEKSQ